MRLHLFVIWTKTWSQFFTVSFFFFGVSTAATYTLQPTSWNLNQSEMRVSEWNENAASRADLMMNNKSRDEERRREARYIEGREVDSYKNTKRIKKTTEKHKKHTSEEENDAHKKVKKSEPFAWLFFSAADSLVEDYILHRKKFLPFPVHCVLFFG